jgi:lipid II:glycine glycyltransferase (peptidoglycan interpeptide bridge formation enzyme)
MDKTKAAQKYYFSKEFIEDHFKLLDTVLVQLEYKNKIIGSSINPYGKNYIYGFLTGTSAEKNVYPSHLMLFELMKWAKDRNFKYLNIGGGLRKNDNLFLYKKGFSKKEFPFYIAKLIFNEDIYNELTNINNKVDSKNYFPNYRFGLDENIL